MTAPHFFEISRSLEVKRWSRAWRRQVPVRYVPPDETAIIVASHISSRACCQHHPIPTYLTPARTCHLQHSAHPIQYPCATRLFNAWRTLFCLIVPHTVRNRGRTIHPWTFANISYRTQFCFVCDEMTIHDAGIAFPPWRQYLPTRNAPFHLHPPLLWFPVVTRIAGIRFFAGNADSLMSIRDWYSRFARLTGIMRKYMPGFVRWDMTMVSPSPVSCAVGHIENSSHNNTIHDFMISRWQNSVIPQSIFNVWHIPRNSQYSAEITVFRLATIA